MLNRVVLTAANTPVCPCGFEIARHGPGDLHPRPSRRTPRARQGAVLLRAGHGRDRRDAQGLQFPDQRGTVDPALQRVPGAPQERPPGHRPRGPRPDQARRVARPGPGRVHYLRQAFRQRLSRHEQAVQRRPGRTADGRRLPDAGVAQAVLRSPAARAAQLPRVRAGRADEPPSRGSTSGTRAPSDGGFVPATAALRSTVHGAPSSASSPRSC
jgi:hypothetical protein